MRVKAGWEGIVVGLIMLPVAMVLIVAQAASRVGGRPWPRWVVL